jgi:MFS family permease
VIIEAPPGLWSREFRLYFGARTVSLLGDAMLPVALVVGMLDRGYGASGAGYALAAWMGPMALCILFGGALADRFTPRRMMIGADIARLVVQSLMAVAFATGRQTLVLVLCLQAVSGIAGALFQPGVASLVPQVARDVQRANATLRISEALVSLLAPALAGVLLAFAGPAAVFGLDAATFALSGLCLFAVRLAPLPRAGDTPMWRSLVEGWQEFRSRTWLWAVIVIWAGYGLTVFGPTLPLGGTVITQDHGETAFGLVMSAFGAGTAVGGVLGLRLRPARPLAAGAVAMFAFALSPLVAALALPVYLIGAGFAMAGLGFAFWSVMWATTVQTQIPAPLLNRVYAYDVAGSLMILPIGRALAGPAAQLAGARTVLFAAACLGIAGCVALLAVPAIRNLRSGPRSPVDDETTVVAAPGLRRTADIGPGSGNSAYLE